PASGVDLEALERALETKSVTACLLSSSFNNPLGCTMPDGSKIALLRLLGKHDVPLIEDDVYGDIYFGAERPKPFSALDPSGDTIYCSSFSKTIAPGYRIGWLATRRHMQHVLAYKLASTLSSPALPQAALADFLSCGGYDSHLRRIRRTFAENIDKMIRAIARSFPSGTKVSRPAGGVVVWGGLSKPNDGQPLFGRAVQNGHWFPPGKRLFASRAYGP